MSGVRVPQRPPAFALFRRSEKGSSAYAKATADKTAGKPDGEGCPLESYSRRRAYVLRIQPSLTKGDVPCTTKFILWEIDPFFPFLTAEQAHAFERYLKTPVASLFACFWTLNAIKYIVLNLNVQESFHFSFTSLYSSYIPRVCDRGHGCAVRNDHPVCPARRSSY